MRFPSFPVFLRAAALALLVLLGLTSAAGAGSAPAVVDLVTAPCSNGTSNDIYVTIRLTSSDFNVVGAQFFLSYDATKLTYVNATPGPAFSAVPLCNTPGAGTLDYCVQVANNDPGATAGATLATLHFTYLTDVCATSGAHPLVYFGRTGPFGIPTRLSRAGNDPTISTTFNNLGAFSIDHTAPVITCPTINLTHDADAGVCTYTYPSGTFPAATATDGCDPAPAVIFLSRTGGATLTDPFHEGDTVTFKATDACGNSSMCTVIVHVNPVNDVVVSVELESVNAAPFARCITFVFANSGGFGSCSAQTRSQVVTFTMGLGQAAFTDLPCSGPSGGPYSSVTARDRLHTLRRTSLLGVSGGGGGSPNTYTASFTGSNALVGGNLNDDAYIDILDFGVFIGQYGMSVGADTACGQAPPLRHADLNGDGLVEGLDYTFISTNFLRFNDPDQCGALYAPDQHPAPPPNQPGGAVTDISVADLAAWDEVNGWEIARTADVNRDGRVNAADVAFVLAHGAAAARCAADFDGRGGVGIDDVFTYINSWLAGHPACDMNDDRGVTIDDLFTFINLWLAGCP